jgi:hypothetical protein
MLIPNLSDGLGNMMFQAASTYSLAKQTGHTFGVASIPISPHSTVDYSETIFKPLKNFYLKDPVLCHFLAEMDHRPIDIDMLRKKQSTNFIMKGWFQHSSYLEPNKEDIKSLFDLPVPRVDTEDAYFLHVRRGDYIKHNMLSLFFIDLQTYYKRAVERMGGGVAHIVTNDIPWCEEWSFLKDVRHTIVKENEVESMAIMASCGKGGIAANSTYSWWGLYLDTSRPHLILPNEWFPSYNPVYDISRLHFRGSTVLEV